MAEGSKDAAILIAISFQALTRQLAAHDPKTQVANCTVALLFAGFYVEATLDYLVAEMNKKPQMMGFLNPSNNPRYHPGIEQKVCWFYNEFIARRKATNKAQFKQLNTYRKIRYRFPGFAELLTFRNDVSHGRVNRSANSLVRTQVLRKQAKAIRSSLYATARKRNPSIKAEMTYWAAIGP